MQVLVVDAEGGRGAGAGEPVDGDPGEDWVGVSRVVDGWGGWKRGGCRARVRERYEGGGVVVMEDLQTHLRHPSKGSRLSIRRAFRIST